jgi:hypothetical protein
VTEFPLTVAQSTALNDMTKQTLPVFYAMLKISSVGEVLKDFVCPVLRPALRCFLWQFGKIAFNNNSK